MLDEPLARIRETVEGVRAVLLVGMDGMIVASSGSNSPADWDLLAASYADLARKVAVVQREADLAPPSEMIFIDGGAFLVRAVTPEYFLLAVLEPQGSIGRTRFELRKAASSMLPELEV